MRWFRRLSYWIRFRGRQDDLRDELADHYERRVADLERQGLSPDDARTTARRAMGNMTYMRESARQVWLPAALDASTNDARHAWRGLLRSPGFTAVVVLTLALTIGANASIFSVVHHLLLAPLPYPAGNEIVRVETYSAGDPDVPWGVPMDVWKSWQARSHTLIDFAAARTRRFALGTADGSEKVAGASITPSFMTTLRIRPLRGRDFVPDDAAPGAAPVAIIGYALWQTQYGGAPDVLGSTLRVDGTTRRIVGIGPAEMNVPMRNDDRPQIWLPLSPDSDNVTDRFARLRPGIATDLASHELQSMMTGLSDATRRARVVRARDLIDPSETRAMHVLFAAVGALLLIACANIAHLLLARGWARQREIATRRALGASRGRIAFYALTESLMLAVLGGGLGLLVAWRGLHVLIGLRPVQLSELAGVHIEGAVLWWTTAIAVGCGLLFGIAPALLTGAHAMTDSLRIGAHTTDNRTMHRVRAGLLFAEVVLSFVFLVATSLLVRSFVALEGTSIGYDPAGLVAVGVRFAHDPRALDRDAVQRALVRSVAAMPGVDRVALGGFPGGLLVANVDGGPFAVDGPSGPQVSDLPFCEMPFVGADYFRTIGLPLIEGRGFEGDGSIDMSRAVVVNQALAKRLWPAGNALGGRLRIGEGRGATWLTVIGVAGDLRLPGLTHGDLFTLQMYRPVPAAREIVASMVLHTTGDIRSPALELNLRSAIERAGYFATMASMDPAESVLDRRVMARPRFALALFGVFATLALAVSAVGLYSAVAYEVVRRSHEIGIRVALGAAPGSVARLVLVTNARLIAIGGGIGCTVAYLGAKTMTSLLYGVNATDPVAFAAAGVCLVVVAVGASLVPAWRAVRIDPAVALRLD